VGDFRCQVGDQLDLALAGCAVQQTGWMNDHAVAVADAIRFRRTNLRMDRERAVPTDLLNTLISLAVWAPNHRLTEPWRFAVFAGSARQHLGNVTADFQEQSGMTDPDKLEKTRGKFLRAPVVVLVASESDPAAPGEMQAEDRDAVAAGVQNMLLGATAHRLGSYWGTGAVCQSPEVRSLAGFADHATVVAAVYFGWPIGDVPVPTRSAPVVSWMSA
jgi:nitroreductase